MSFGSVGPVSFGSVGFKLDLISVPFNCKTMASATAMTRYGSFDIPIGQAYLVMDDEYCDGFSVEVLVHKSCFESGEDFTPQYHITTRPRTSLEEDDVPIPPVVIRHGRLWMDYITTVHFQLPRFAGVNVDVTLSMRIECFSKNEKKISYEDFYISLDREGLATEHW